MANLLYLVHRIPYPAEQRRQGALVSHPKHLAARHRVFLGTFVDDPDDLQHVARLRELCAELHVIELSPRLARLRSVSGVRAGEPLTVAYYRNAELARWVDADAGEQAIDAVHVFSSAMAQYVAGADAPRDVLIDFVDVDSAKWDQYANSRRWPLSCVYGREGARLLAFERAAADRATRAFFVTEAEADLFRACTRVRRTHRDASATASTPSSSRHRRRFHRRLRGIVAGRLHRCDGLLAERRWRALVCRGSAPASCSTRCPAPTSRSSACGPPLR